MKLLRLIYCVLLLQVIACKEKYDLPFTGPARGYLVVEGYINRGAGPTTFKLSRTIALVDTINVNPERSAIVTVEGNDNSSVTLTEIGTGTYSVNQLFLTAGRQYRLHIKTKDGKDYYSDFTPLKATPVIDGISWERIDKGVELFVNTHDAQNNTRYYRWEYEETWEFHSSHYSVLEYIFNPATGAPRKVQYRDPVSANKLFYCWKSEKSSSILIGSSVKLSTDSIHLPVQLIPNASWKLSVLYSILVKQYAISADEYEFLRRMKKNTEQVGSLFDAQPSELKGNIHNSKDPNELVLGFVGITEPQEKRIFIKNSEVPNWNYQQACEKVDVAYIER